MSQGVDTGEIVDCNYLYWSVRGERGAEKISTDSTKTIDTNLDHDYTLYKYFEKLCATTLWT
jgi:hypothetical protein